MAEGTDPTTALALILAPGGVDPVPGLILLVEGRAPEDDCPLAEEVPPDVDPPAQGTDIGVLQFEGDALVLLRHLVAVPLALGLLEKQ